MAVGRISGPLLKANLLRQGVDLAFETDLLYLDVVNGRVGIKTATPDYDLDVNGTVRTTNLIVPTNADIATFTFNGNTISSTAGQININPSTGNAVLYQAKIRVNNNLEISSNSIKTTVTDADLELGTLGTGQVQINSNVLVNGDLHATGSITADGSITIGDSNTDSIIFNADIASNIVPDANNTYDLGEVGKEWRTSYINDVQTTTLSAANIQVNGIDLALPQGNIIYVAKNGSDTNAGVHENDPVLTVKYALSFATSGDTVYIYPGDYTEEFPLTVPIGVTVKGTSLRSVKIVPTVGTSTESAFLVNGETTVEDITIADFYAPGYAFKFVDGFIVSSRSPYIRNLTVLTKGTVITPSDPLGYDSGDAGRGAFVDGTLVDPGSKEAAMLFHSVTFICPGANGITATNGARVEWLNSFTYYANQSMLLYSSPEGFASAGNTRLRINTRVGTWAIGNTVNYYDTDGTTSLASGVISSIDGNYVNLTGRCLGFETITDRIPTAVYTQGNAKLSTAQQKFGVSSLVLDGNGDYLTVATQPDFAFGTGEFCIEMWVYRTGGSGAIQVLADFRASNPQVVPVLFLSATNYYPSLTVNGATEINGTTTVPLNTWTHIAVAKSGTSTKIFMNGIQQGFTYTDTNNYIQGPLTIGARFDGTTPFFGYVDDVRVSKGTARYTTTFTPPAVALTGDLSTVLLLHFNGANNSTTMLDDGITLQDLRTSAGGTASIINFADYSDFGVELRSIGSAAVYGNYGVVGTGPGVIAYLISENFAYIGSGKLATNDPNDRIPTNEIVESDGAKIYYTSVDNEGNFKVGDNFYVNQKTGEVLFNNQAVSITSVEGVVFTDGVNTTTLTPSDITTGNIRISGNTVSSLTGDINVSAASGQINLQNTTYVTGDLDITGDLTIGGNIQIGDQTTDTISFVGGINSDLIPATNTTYDLGTPSLRWNNAYLSRIQVDGVVIDSNTISTTVGNDDLTLVANGTGRVYIPDNNVQINQNLTVGGNLAVTGSVGQITYSGLSWTLTSPYAWIFVSGLNAAASTWVQSLQPGDVFDIVNFSGTTVTVTVDYVSGPGTVGSFADIHVVENVGFSSYPSASNPSITVSRSVGGTTSLKNVGVTGTITQTGDFNQTGNFTTSGTVQSDNLTVTGTITLPQIQISANTISTLVSGTDLNLTANGTGNVVFEGIKVTNNDIQSTVTNSNITLTPQGTGTVIINSNQSIQIPVGTTLQRPGVGTATNGMIRYNTDLGEYEGYNNGHWLKLGGVADASRKTRILPELTPGSNNNTLYFYANDNLTAFIDSTKLFAERFQTSNLDINNNVISSINTNTDINITTSGTGGVRVGNLKIFNNTITNTVAGAVTEFVQGVNGFVRIPGTNGVVIPSGDTLTQRPTGSNAERGMMRFNTDGQLVEVYNGVSWSSVAGASGGVTTAEATELGIASALIFG